MSTVHTVALQGMTGHLLTLTLTAAAADGPSGIVLTGGSGRDETELRDRVRAALAHSGQPNRDYRVEVHGDEQALTPPAAAVATAAFIATATLAEDMPHAAQRMAATAVLGEVDGAEEPVRDHVEQALGLRRARDAGPAGSEVR